MKQKITITLAGTKETAKGSAPSPRISVVELDTKERMTVTIGNAIRHMMVGFPLYKSYGPAISVQVEGETVGYITKFDKGSNTQWFTAVNMEVLRLVMTSRFTTEELINLSSSKDPIVNNIAQVFGHKGTAINIAGAEQNLKSKQTSLSHILQYAKEGGNKLYQEQTPKEVQDWKKAQAETRKLESAQKKAAKLIEN